MDLSRIFQPVPEITVAELRELMAGGSAASWYLLDVRQSEEYEAGHLPGAHLIELGRLHEQLEAVPPKATVVVYCHSGRRSASATAILRHAGIEGARNLVGGVLAWQDAMVGGWPMTPMEPILGEGPVTAEHLQCAASLELGTRTLYEAIAADSRADRTVRGVFADLAADETAHTALLKALCGVVGEDGASFDQALASIDEHARCIEGGAEAVRAVAWAKQAELRDVVEVAAGSEALAWDRYRVLAHRSTDARVTEGLEKLARGEQTHLKRLLSLYAGLSQAP
jgi:hydroxyacylglutathione hydrolase